MKVNFKTFIPAILIIGIIVTLVFVNLAAVQNAVNIAYDACISNFGWFFALVNITCIIFSLWIMFGRYKNVKLGGEDSKPTFKFLSWAAMMFTTSCGAWLIVYGFLEPIYCAAQAPFGIDPLSTQALEMGQAYAHFHWGPNAWCIYVPSSIAIGYLLYNRNKAASMSSVCYELMPNKAGKVIGYVSDIIAICSAVIAPVISLGTGMPLLVVLVQYLFKIPVVYTSYIEIGILCIWILIFGISVFLGLNKGIKKLSNINVVLAFCLMSIIGLFAGIFFAISAEVNTIGILLNNYIRMSTYTDAFGTGSFVKGWTIGYWACYFVYMPLMGVFNAKISKGRRLKDVAFGQLVFCSLGCWVAMATFGNYSMKLQSSGALNIAEFLKSNNEAGAILAIMQTLPWPNIIMAFLLIVCFIFLATTMDSSAFVAAEMTMLNSEKRNAPRWLRITWAVIASIVAYALLQVGGAKAVRTLCYIAGLPLAALEVLIMLSIIKMLKQDYPAIKSQTLNSPSTINPINSVSETKNDNLTQSDQITTNNTSCKKEDIAIDDKVVNS